jgi:hypothetical protein
VEDRQIQLEPVRCLVSVLAHPFSLRVQPLQDTPILSALFFESRGKLQIERAVHFYILIIPGPLQLSHETRQSCKYRSFEVMTAEDKILFGQVADELKNAILDEALYAKAFSEAEGDINSAKARYIKLRVNELREICEQELKSQHEAAKEKQRREAQEIQQREEEARVREAVEHSAARQRERDAIIIEKVTRSAARDKRFSKCPNCNFVGVMKYSFFPPKGHVFGASAVKCSECNHRFDWHYIVEK